MAGNMVDIPSTHKLVFLKFTSVFHLLFLKGKNYVLLQWGTHTISTGMEFGRGQKTSFGLVI
jgi:hypothetical protein